MQIFVCQFSLCAYNKVSPHLIGFYLMPPETFYPGITLRIADLDGDSLSIFKCGCKHACICVCLPRMEQNGPGLIKIFGSCLFTSSFYVPHFC